MTYTTLPEKNAQIQYTNILQSKIYKICLSVQCVNIKISFFINQNGWSDRCLKPCKNICYYVL